MIICTISALVASYCKGEVPKHIYMSITQPLQLHLENYLWQNSPSPIGRKPAKNRESFFLRFICPFPVPLNPDFLFNSVLTTPPSSNSTQSHLPLYYSKASSITSPTAAYFCLLFLPINLDFQLTAIPLSL